MPRADFGIKTSSMDSGQILPRTGNSIVSSLILAKLDIVRDGIPSLICKVLCMKHSVADKSVVSGPISPKLKLVREFLCHLQSIADTHISCLLFLFAKIIHHLTPLVS